MGINKRLLIPQDSGDTNTDNFAPFLYTGTGSSAATTFTGVGFDPDMVWVKNRDSSGENHGLGDTVRGGGYLLYPNLALAQATSDYIRPTTDGFIITTGNNNISNHNYVAWCWKAGGDDVLNEQGSIDSQVSANPDAGFSIVKWTSDGFSGIKTMGHGLSQAPELIIVKNLDISDNWAVYSATLGNNLYLRLNTTDSQVTGTNYWSTSATNFGLRQSSFFNNGDEGIAYCFHSVDGYQKVGSYTGTGTAGLAVTTGFRPRFVMYKNTDANTAWVMIDSVRGTGTNTKYLFANTSGEEGTGAVLDFTDTGFTLLSSNSTTTNYLNNTYIYLAIA